MSEWMGVVVLLLFLFALALECGVDDDHSH